MNQASTSRTYNYMLLSEKWEEIAGTLRFNERLRELCAKTRALKALSTQQKHRCFCV
jgi:hypothetical protein